MPVTDQPISGLAALTAATLASTDLIEVVDVSDLTDSANGSNRKIEAGQFATGITSLSDFAAAIYAAAQPPITAKTADFSCALTDVGKFIPLNKATAGQVTIPLNATTAIPVGSWLTFIDIGAARWTFVPEGGVTINAQPNVTGNAVTLGQFSLVMFHKYATNTWNYVGSVASVGGAINAQVGTTYSFALTDSSALVTLLNGSAITATVPANATTAFALGTQIDFAQLGAGQVTVAAAGGVTINATPGLKLRAQYSGGSLKKIATNTWLLFGDLAA